MTRLRTTAAVALTACAGLIVSALLTEGAVLLLLGEQSRFPRHVVGADFGVRINQPEARYRHASAEVDVEFRINSRGLRADREYDYEKPEGTLRIVSLGDSFTVGYEVEVQEAFSSVLERALRRSGYEVEVLNAGVSGYSTAESLVYLERELFRYEPDLVLLSFFPNDLIDNVRAGLFRLEEGRLVDAAPRYVPAGRLGDFLNTSRGFNWLSERSNAFAFVKERATLLAKRDRVRENWDNAKPETRSAMRAQVVQAQRHQRRLATTILDRMYAGCRAREIPLVIQSIPIPDRPMGPTRLLDLFPPEFEHERPGLLLVSARDVLTSRLRMQLLYHERSHGHWTPEAHRLAGEALADAILEAGLLQRD
jgi:lysophospholipase L1-like esterase